MKILLTGAAGFLAHACLPTLLAAGHDVITTDRNSPVDLRGDLAEARFVATLPQVDVVVHAAAVQYVSADLPFWNRRRYFVHNNVEATRQLVSRYAHTGAHFVNVATSMIYRQCGAPSYSPQSDMQGQGVYSISKLAAQRLVERVFPDWATVVPCIIGGYGREGLFRSFVQSIKRSGGVAFPGRGDHPIHMVHVDDVATLIELIVRKRATGYFNAGAPEPLSIMQWIDVIASELGVANVKVRRLPLAPVHAVAALAGYRPLAHEQLLMLAQPHVLDISRALALGWIPQRTNAQIVRDIAQYITSQPNAHTPRQPTAWPTPKPVPSSQYVDGRTVPPYADTP